ncbi:MAG: FtsQ-type POTRA domain-containing protein [Actinomycetota bacterium]|nr:FtsQ-type POTRA domain-containing protein [Actinomycetota bacterium]
MTARSQTDPRISRRRKAVARSRTRRIAGTVSAIVALGAVGWAAFASPLLAVDEVKVVGAEHTTAADIAQAAGLDTSDNLLLVSTEAIARAAETLPWVKTADVERILPGTVRVRVTERVPAMVLSIGAARWTIDVRGRVLAVGESETARDRGTLPVLSGAETGDVEVGGSVSAPELVDALKAYRSLDRSLRRRVVGIVAPSLERITFSLADGTLIRFGAAERLRAKNEVLSALLEEVAREGRAIAYIDVRVPTSPAIAPASGAPPSSPEA